MRASGIYVSECTFVFMCVCVCMVAWVYLYVSLSPSGHVCVNLCELSSEGVCVCVCVPECVFTEGQMALLAATQPWLPAL